MYWIQLMAASLKMIQSYEVVVYAYTIKNIYLSSKGVYTVKLSLQIDGSQLPSLYQPSHPYMLFKSKLKNRQSTSGKVSLQNNTFVSEKLEMRYIDQEVFLSDVIGYKIELKQGSSPITLVCTLEKQETSNQTEIINQYETQIKISSLKQGICEYIEVPFQQNHQISLNLCLFSILSDSKQDEQQVLIKQNVCGTNKQQNYKHYLKQIRYHSFISQQNLSQLSPNLHQSLTSSIEEAAKYFSYQNKHLTEENYSEAIYQVCIKNYVFIKKFLEVLQSGQFNIDPLKQNYYRMRRQKYTDFVFKTKQNGSTPSTQQRVKCAKKVRKSSTYQSISKKILPVQIEGQFLGIENQPIMFYEVENVACQNQSSICQFQNLYVLIHGFQGKHKDLVLLRNNIKYFDPQGFFILSKSNEEVYDESIFKMGENLATEIIQFMTDQGLKRETTKLHFFGFSMGGVIARASFKHLGNMNFGRYTSISTPHLGSADSETLVSIGLFMLRNLCKFKCISELCFSDSINLEQTTMFRLSEEGTLNRFQEVVLVSNNRDSFVTWQSARIQPVGGKIRKIQDKMIENILNNKHQIRKVHRLDFDSKQSKTSIIHAKQKIQEVIGRTAHMEFIKSDVMIRMMLNSIPL